MSAHYSAAVGPTGPKGDAGPQGAQGPAGPTGPSGSPELIAAYAVTNAAGETSFDFTGLLGNGVDEKLRLEIEVQHDAGLQLGLKINDDAAAANYRLFTIAANSGAAPATEAWQQPWIANLAAAVAASHATITVELSLKSGRARTGRIRTVDVTPTMAEYRFATGGYAWNNTAAEAVKLTVFSTVASALKVGTVARLYRERLA